MPELGCSNIARVLFPVFPNDYDYIATFFLKKNSFEIGSDVIRLIRIMTALVLDSLEAGDVSGFVGDYEDSVIILDSSLDSRQALVHLVDKNWSDEMIIAFKGVVEGLAQLHRWKVEEENVFPIEGSNA